MYVLCASNPALAAKSNKPLLLLSYLKYRPVRVCDAETNKLIYLSTYLLTYILIFNRNYKIIMQPI